MDKRTKGCLLVAIGVSLLLVIVGIALVAGAGYWFYQQFSIEAGHAAPETAERAIDDERARFGDARPFIVVEGDRAHMRPDVQAAPPAAPAPIQSLRVMAFNARDRQLVRVSIPFWLIRLAPDGRISASHDALKDIKGAGDLTVQELEALGPGLLVDHRDADGSRVLVWTE